MRRKVQMIFQDPYGSLNPRSTVGRSVAQPHGDRRLEAEATAERVDTLLRWVGLPADAKQRYPHEFSGGQRQRIGIARALALSPKLIICDEPVSALDVSVRAQVINLLEDLKGQFGVSYLFISHDLSVVEHIADRVAVMYLGTLVEVGGARSDLAQPAAPLHQGPAGGGADRQSQGWPAPASARSCRASCRARSIRRPAARSIRAARSPRSAARPTGRCCGRSATARWRRAISSELAMIRRMTKPARLRFCSAALLPSAVASAQTMDFACPDPGTTFTYDSGTKVVARGRDGMDCTMEIVGRQALTSCARCCSTIPRPTAPTRRPSSTPLKPERLWPLAGRQEDRGALQRRRPDLALHPDRGALREAHRARATP